MKYLTLFTLALGLWFSTAAQAQPVPPVMLAWAQHCAVTSLAIDSQASGSGSAGGGLAAKSSTENPATVPVTFSFSNAAGTYMFIPVVVTVSGTPQPTTVTATYNGVSAILLASIVNWNTNNDSVYLFGLANPATGTNTVSVNATGGTAWDVMASAITFKGVNTAAPINTSNIAQTINTTASASTSATVAGTASGDYVLSVLGAGSAITAATSPTTMSASVNVSNNTGSDNFGFGEQRSSGGSVTAAYTMTSDISALLAVEVKQASQSSCGTVPNATAYSLSGPSSGFVGTASSPFLATSNGKLTSAVTLTPNDNGNGGSFVPAVCTLPIGNFTTCQFTYTAAVAATIPIAGTNSASLINPNPLSYVATNPTADAFIVCATATCANASDANPGTLAQPFVSLGRCQTAMEGSSTKACQVRVGSYTQGSQLTLGSSDANEAWANYPPDGYCSAVLNGNGVFDMFVVGVAGVSFTGLEFTNIGQAAINPVGANHGGVAVAGTLIEYNCFTNFTNNGANGGPVGIWGTQGVKVFNNVFWNLQAEAINAAITQSGDNFSGWDVENNFIANCDTVTNDMGCIYAWSGVQTTATPGTFTWKNNYVNNFGTSANFNKGLYLDDAVSGGTVTSNVIVGTGEFAVQVHGGQNNLINNNIFDLGDADNQYAIIWQGDGATNMAGNQAKGNLVINWGTSVQPAWFNNGGVTTAPAISDNVYWNFTGGPNASSGSSGYTDSSPQVENPDFTDSTWVYTVSASSPVISPPVSFPTLPANWGYPGFAIPKNTFGGQSITEPSYLE